MDAKLTTQSIQNLNEKSETTLNVADGLVFFKFREAEEEDNFVAVPLLKFDYSDYFIQKYK